MKEKMNKLDIIIMKSSVMQNTVLREWKVKRPDYEKVFAKHISDKERLSKMYENSEKSTIRKETFINGQKTILWFKKIALKNGQKIWTDLQECSDRVNQSVV